MVTFCLSLSVNLCHLDDGNLRLHIESHYTIKDFWKFLHSFLTSLAFQSIEFISYGSVCISFHTPLSRQKTLRNGKPLLRGKKKT